MAVAVTPDGQRAVSASEDNTVKVWDLETGEVLATFTCDSRGAIAAHFPMPSSSSSPATPAATFTSSASKNRKRRSEQKCRHPFCSNLGIQGYLRKLPCRILLAMPAIPEHTGFVD